MFHDYMNPPAPPDRYIKYLKTQKEVLCTGFMDVNIIDEDTNEVIEPPSKWSGCSVHDFRSAFKERRWDKTCFIDNEGRNLRDNGKV